MKTNNNSKNKKSKKEWDDKGPLKNKGTQKNEGALFLNQKLVALHFT